MTKETIPRKYFAGGVVLRLKIDMASTLLN
jgi:hypothetical protein